MKVRKILKISWIALAVIVVLGLALVAFSNFAVNKISEGKTFSELKQVPQHRVGLILGTKYSAIGDTGFCRMCFAESEVKTVTGGPRTDAVGDQLRDLRHRE